jgi:enoyl-CoA hydratase/carnithine racemase
MTGDPISAQEAYRLGLVNKIAPGEELMQVTEAMVGRINENGPLAVRAVKELAYRGIQMPLEEGLRLETTMLARIMCSQDAAEGPRAFTEKRKPKYLAK